MKVIIPIFTVLLISQTTLSDEAEQPVINADLFLHMMQSEVAEGAMESESQRVSVHAPRFKGKNFGEISARHKGAVMENGIITFRGFDYPSSKDKAEEQYKKPSFIVDYDDPIFEEVDIDIAKQFGKKPNIVQLREYVSKFIDKKTMHRSFDMASTVVKTREGDCSEHAILLAALARRFGFVARIVFGVVIVEVEGKVVAIGHAWVEYREKKKWNLVDAALTAGEDGTEIKIHSYIPVRVQKDEGPGYSSEMINSASLILIEKIEIH